MGITSARRRLSGQHTVWGEGPFISGSRPSEDEALDATPTEARTPSKPRTVAKKASKSAAKKSPAKKTAPKKAASTKK